jgi:hypothetical protein
MNDSKSKPKVRLVGEDGNAFAILGRVSKAMSGDYNHLFATVLEYVDDIGEEDESNADDEN